MFRHLACLGLLLPTAIPATAQPQPGEPIPLILSPALLPTPSTKYHLLPEKSELEPGNAATLYYRSQTMFVENGPLLQDIKGGAWSVWATMPLQELPLQEVGNRLATLRQVLREVDLAARRRDCDWQIDHRPEGFALLIPDVQTFRSIAQVLAVRARYEMARGHFPEAIEALQSGYTLAYHLGQGPFLIQNLVGVAIAHILDLQLETLLQQPDAPNLYWSLATLPQPFMDLRTALQEERYILERTLPGFQRLEDGPMSLAQVAALQQEVHKSFDVFNIVHNNVAEVAVGAWAQFLDYPIARQALRQEGVPVDQLEAMPPFQIVSLWAWHRYQRAWEDYLMWTHVPHFEREPGFQQAEERLKQATILIDQVYTGGIFARIGFLSPPAVSKVFQAVQRADRRFAALRCVEAIRLYAATHDRHLPASLADIKDVPIPTDPWSGEPFRYELKGDRAVLTAPLTKESSDLPLRLVYELSLRP